MTDNVFHSVKQGIHNSKRDLPVPPRTWHSNPSQPGQPEDLLKNIVAPHSLPRAPRAPPPRHRSTPIGRGTRPDGAVAASPAPTERGFPAAAEALAADCLQQAATEVGSAPRRPISDCAARGKSRLGPVGVHPATPAKQKLLTPLLLPLAAPLLRLLQKLDVLQYTGTGHVTHNSGGFYPA